MKFIKKYYLLLLLIITLTGISLYGTYAMFTQEIGIDTVKLEASTIPVDQEIMEYEKITINASDSKTISLNVNNSTNQSLHYGAWYQMISPSTINNNITIAKLTDSPDETSGTINGNSNKKVYIYIGNNSSSAITLYVGIKYSETSSLGLPDNRLLITDTRDGKYVVGVTVTNGTVENGVTLTNLITNGSFEDGSNGWSLSNASVTNIQHVSGTNSLMLNANTTAMSTQTLSESAPTINHHYYGKLSFLSSDNFTNADNRYEWYYTDNSEALLVFANKNISTTDWKVMSNILSMNSATYLSENWYIRNFVVNANTTSYVDDLVLVDLTNSYGSSYPSKEMLDRSIGYFDGSVSYNYQKLNKGNSTSFVVNPNSGYIIDSVSCTNSNANYNNNTLTITNITGDVQCNVKFKNSSRTSSEMLAYLGLSANPGSPNFGSAATTNEGVYAMQDDYGTSYYFRGAVPNNYIKFAGYYWRIVRINGNGSLRLIYDGTSVHANGESSTDRQIGTSSYNSYLNGGRTDNAYAGYMYGSLGATNYNDAHANINNSTIKATVDNWYKTNIQDAGYSDKVDDVIYCNDRKLISGNGYGASGTTIYRAYQDIENNKAVLTCSQINDRFTVDDTTNGNGALTYPVGLLTADEILIAGALSNYINLRISNTSFYLFTGQSFWTMTPGRYIGTYVGIYQYYYSDYNDEGYMREYIENSSAGIRPVISLKSDITLTGSGTQNDPWIVQ